MNDEQENKILWALLKGEPEKVIDTFYKILNAVEKRMGENQAEDLQAIRKILKEEGKDKVTNAIALIRDLIGDDES